MDLKDMALLVALQDTGRLNLAADHLGLSVSALSHRLAALETRLGRPLFVRGRDGMRPTPAAAAVIRHAREAVLAAERAQEAARVPGREVRIGSAWLMATTVLPRLLAGLGSADRPGLIDVRTGRSQDVLDWVENQEVELGLIRASAARPGVALQPVGGDPVVLAVPAGHPWTVVAPDRTALQQATFVGVAEQTGYGRFLAGALRQAGLALTTGVVVDHLEAALALVAAGLGPAWLPLSLVNRHGSAEAVRVVDTPAWVLPRRALALAWPEGRDLPGWAAGWPERLKRWLKSAPLPSGGDRVAGDEV
jgi:DNA-binding transcriptional LysR family regulator